MLVWWEPPPPPGDWDFVYGNGLKVKISLFPQPTHMLPGEKCLNTTYKWHYLQDLRFIFIKRKKILVYDNLSIYTIYSLHKAGWQNFEIGWQRKINQKILGKLLFFWGGRRGGGSVKIKRWSLKKFCPIFPEGFGFCVYWWCISSKFVLTSLPELLKYFRKKSVWIHRYHCSTLLLFRDKNLCIWITVFSRCIRNTFLPLAY